MEQLKIVSKSSNDVAGRVCPLPDKGGIGTAKGAMGSAIVTLVL